MDLFDKILIGIILIGLLSMSVINYHKIINLERINDYSGLNIKRPIGTFPVINETSTKYDDHICVTYDTLGVFLIYECEK